MSGFLSSSTALMVCKADSAASLDLAALRQHAFTPEIDADGRRFGWVSLGDHWTPMVLNWPLWMPASWAFPSGWTCERRPEVICLRLAGDMLEEIDFGKNVKQRKQPSGIPSNLSED